MIKKIAFIGITGNLAQFVYPQLIQKGIKIKALVRNIKSLERRKNFSEEIDLIEGDLSQTDKIRQCIAGADAVYLNLSTTDAKASFQAEIHGIQNIIEVAQEQNIKRIFHVSAITAAHPEFAQGADLFINEIRKEGYRLLKVSGIPCTFFHCSWIMDTIEFSMRKGSSVQGFKPIRHPMFWLAGKDLGNMIVRAIDKSEHQQTKEYIMQGAEALRFEEALSQYATNQNPPLKVQLAPIGLLKFIGLFNKEAKLAAQVGSFFSNYKEEFRAEKTWEELGKPEYTIRNFWQ